MGKISTTNTEWIEEVLLPEILKFIGVKRDGVRFITTLPDNCHFASYVFFLDLKFVEAVNNDKSEYRDTLKLVVKKLVSNGILLTNVAEVEDFHNEILFYTKFATGSSQFPRCIYANDESKNDTVIVLENLSSQGYGICPDTYDIPTPYVYATITEIAKLHAMGYVMKKRESDKFHNIVSDIRGKRFNNDGWFRTLVNGTASRPIDWLRSNNCEKQFCDDMEKFLSNAYENIMMPAVEPMEPLATLCHGDVTRNNIFFRNINGKLEAKLFDFGQIIYSSPAIDLSTFLYLCCSAKDRVEGFDHLFRFYHCTLIEYLRDFKIEDLEKFSHDNMLADYKRRAAFGFILATFFLIYIYGYVKIPAKTIIDDLKNSVVVLNNAGGDSINEILGQMILELRDLGSFDHIAY